MKNVTTKQDNVPAKVLFDSKDFDAGFESTAHEDYAIPILRILQALSPQCIKSDSRYIKGAEAGMIYNTVTKEIYDGEVGIDIIPCYFNSVQVEYVPREKGGGFVDVYYRGEEPEVAGTNEKGKPILKNGNTLVQTAQHFVLLKHGENYSPCLMPMESTNLSISRNWLSFMRQQMISVNGELKTLPMYGSVYRATTQTRHKDNNTWYVWRVDLHKTIDNAYLLNMARSAHKTFSTDSRKIITESSRVGDACAENINEDY